MSCAVLAPFYQLQQPACCRSLSMSFCCGESRVNGEQVEGEGLYGVRGHLELHANRTGLATAVHA